MNITAWVLLYLILVLLTIMAAYEMNYMNPYLAGVLWVGEVAPIVIAFLVYYYHNTSPRVKKIGKHSRR